MGSVVIADQRPLDGFTGGPVVPDGGGHGEQPLGDAGVDAFGGAAAVPFEVELAFEGVVDRLDQLADRSEQRLAVARDLVFAGRPQQDGPAGSQASFGDTAGEALVGDQDQAGPGGGQLGLSTSSMAASTSRSPVFGSARAHKIGIPAGVQTRYSRSPQNQREWLAQ